MTTTKILESGAARGTGKRRRAKLIAADVWGSSAFYPAEVLARDAATAFPVGTKMFENHLTESEQWERPVGDVSKLVGKLISEGQYEADNPEGPGVYADVEFYDSYVDRINEIGDDVGLSVDGAADYVEGERDGRYGKIVTGIPYIKSVDVVVAAGAGGKLISILESAGPMAGIPIKTEGDQSVTDFTKADFEVGMKGLLDNLEKLSTQIQEALAPLAAAQAANTETTETTEDTEHTKPVGAEGEETTEDTETKEDEPEIDHVALATEFAAAGLPAEVMPNVIASVKEGKSIKEAIEGQTKIREAFLAQVDSSTVRIVESDRNDNRATTSLREGILAKFN